MTQFLVTWTDAKREPRCAPDPAYPNGRDVIMTHPGEASCKTSLPYPARRIGSYEVQCLLCGCKVLLTTAGRADDPRSATLPCRAMARA